MIAFPTQLSNPIDTYESAFRKASINHSGFPEADYQLSLPLDLNQEELASIPWPRNRSDVLSSAFSNQLGMKVFISFHLPLKELSATDWLEHELVMRGSPTELDRIDRWTQQGRISQVLVSDSNRIHRLSVVKTAGRIFLIDASVPESSYQAKQEELLIICSTLQPLHTSKEEEDAWLQAELPTFSSLKPNYPNGWQAQTGRLESRLDFLRLTNKHQEAWKGELNLFVGDAAGMGHALSLAHQHLKRLGFDLDSNELAAVELPWFEESPAWQVVECRETSLLQSQTAIRFDDDMTMVILWISVRPDLNRLWHSINQRCFQIVTESLVDGSQTPLVYA